MINFDYSGNEIKITTEDLSKVFTKDQLPLRFDIKKRVSSEVVWTTFLNSFMWASYPENEINDVSVYDIKGNHVYSYHWDAIKHGSIFYKSMWLYCKGLINKGIKPYGLVIGTHDGEFGEWVPLVKDFMSDMTLVEGSEKQYNKLISNYKNVTGLNFVYDIVTPNGGDVEFFEGGKGYTNSVVERVIRSWEKEEIHSTKRKSVSLNDLIIGLDKKLDWLHLDVEGLDVKLLLSLKEEHIPNFIIFEDFNLSEEDLNAINKWIEVKNFTKHSQNGICMITKNQN